MTNIRPYIPPLLPPKIDYGAIVSEVGDARASLGQLASALFNPVINPTLLMTPLLTKEAVISSRIEGTQASVEDVFLYEAEEKGSEVTGLEQDSREVINYRRAVLEGVDLLKKRPLGENLIKRIHQTLMSSVRGTQRDPGNLRRIQVHVGKPGSKVEEAYFVPPPPHELPRLLQNWENYVHSANEKDPLVQVAVAHYQFEAIHPFQDGNGRIGRLLIPLSLYAEKLLPHPVLYISGYFEQNREAYYDFLRLVDQEQRWEDWIKFFLLALNTQSLQTLKAVWKIMELYQELKDQVAGLSSQYGANLLDTIFVKPVVSFSLLKKTLPVGSNQTIYNLLNKFVNAEILKEIGEEKRNRKFMFTRLMYLLLEES